jgi:hypothetical protein
MRIDLDISDWLLLSARDLIGEGCDSYALLQEECQIFQMLINSHLYFPAQKAIDRF